MSTASFSSVLSYVRSSARRAHEVIIGWTQTNGIDRSAASWASTRHRCPVGSHDTVTPAKPFAVARSRGPVQRRSEIPRAAPVGLAARAPSSRDHTRRPSASCPPDRSRRSRSTPAPKPAADPVARCGCDHRGTRHYRYPRTSSSCDGTPSPQRIRRTFLRPASTRRTSFYAAMCAAAQPGCTWPG